MKYLLVLSLLAFPIIGCSASKYEKIGESTPTQTKEAESFLFGEISLGKTCQKQAPLEVLGSDWIIWLTDQLCQKSASRLCTSALQWKEERPTTSLVTEFLTQAEIIAMVKAKGLVAMQPVFIKKSDQASRWDIIKCHSLTLIQPHLELGAEPKKTITDLLKSRGLKTDAQGEWKLSVQWDRGVLQKNRSIDASVQLVILGALDELMK